MVGVAVWGVRVAGCGKNKGKGTIWEISRS